MGGDAEATVTVDTDLIHGETGRDETTVYLNTSESNARFETNDNILSTYEDGLLVDSSIADRSPVGYQNHNATEDNPIGIVYYEPETSVDPEGCDGKTWWQTYHMEMHPEEDPVNPSATVTVNTTYWEKEGSVWVDKAYKPEESDQGNPLVHNGSHIFDFDKDGNEGRSEEISAFKVQYEVSVNGALTDRETIEIDAGGECVY